MGEMEQLGVDAVSLLLGERLAWALKMMQMRRPGIEQVVLADPLAAFPYDWREVLARLAVMVESGLAAQAEGLLGELRGAVSAARKHLCTSRSNSA